MRSPKKVTTSLCTPGVFLQYVRAALLLQVALNSTVASSFEFHMKLGVMRTSGILAEFGSGTHLLLNAL